MIRVIIIDDEQHCSDRLSSLLREDQSHSLKVEGSFQAFKFSAIDYLLKPVDREDLKAAIGRLSDKIHKTNASKKIDTLIHNLHGASKRICVPVVTGLVFLQVNDIIRCQSDVNYTTLYLRDRQKLVVAKTLKEFEELLTDYNFFRVHNSHLINLAYIKNYNKGKGGFLTMTDQSIVEVSTRRKEEFMKKLSEL
jgi:two-component system, LytTR family, response regulator